MIRVGITGAGKIVRDQHLPAVAQTPALSLVAVADPAGGPEGVFHYTSQEAMLASAEIDALVIATPPQMRFDLAVAALKASKHVMLEKPPAMTAAALAYLTQLAEEGGLALFTAWHAQHADAVGAAAAWLSGKPVSRVEIVWREDVRRWHPGQQWIWEPGGMGVFDPGINALSILTRIYPEAIWLDRAELEFPANRLAPIAARLEGRLAGGGTLSADFDWRQEGPQIWTISVEADGQRLLLEDGGDRMSVDGVAVPVAAVGEYPALFRRFAALVESGAREVDARPLGLTADAFMVGRRVEVEAFFEG